MSISATRVAIVGSGFSGIGMAAGLLRAGIDDFVVLERDGDVGGTWRDNTYPGCQCDVPSHLYSFSFAPNPDWTRTYSTQVEIQAYLRRCVRQLGIEPHLRLGHEVLDATWDAAAGRWHIRTTQGTVVAEVLVSAHGALSEPTTPVLPGLERFAGTCFHSASWKHDHALAGRRVAVIGTGASAIQIVPSIQPAVERLVLFQRTPPWVLPHTDRPISRAERWLYRHVPALQRAVRAAIYASRELVVIGMAKRPALLRPLRRLAAAHLRRQVEDEALRAQLMPRYSPGCKRLLLSDDYYPALTAPNVEVVTAGIREVVESGIVTDDGTQHEVDTIVFATGFRVTDHPISERIRGVDGRTLADVWSAAGARAYKGTTVAGFPNLFLMTGPNTGIGHTSLVYMIESQVPYVIGGLRLIHEQDAVIDVRPDVLDAWDARLQRALSRTVWNSGGCASWYLDERGRNAALWPDFTWRFRRLTRHFDAASYQLLPRRERETTPAEVA